MNDFVRKTFIVLAVAALALLAWRIAYALLLAFGAVLFAVFLRGLAAVLRDWTGLGIRVALAVVGLALLGLVAVAALLVGPSIAAQFGELSDTLSQGVAQVRGYLEQSGWGKRLLSGLAQGMQQSASLLGVAGQLVVSALDAVVALVLVVFAGAYLAASPRVYTEGLVRLFPKRRHARAREVIAAAGNALWLWVLAQFVLMAAVGALTAIGLFAIGVPLAGALGLIAGLLEFVPFIGPFVAAVPVILVALSVDSQTALYAALLFLAVQQIESNLLTPLVARRAVALPPVLVLVGAMALALLFGLLGAVFATPLLVLIVVCVKLLYMEDVLGERVELPGERKKAA